MPRAIILLCLIATAMGYAQQEPADRLASLTQEAARLRAAYDLNAAEARLDEALVIATSLGPAEEAAVHIRIAELYDDLQKRDGRDWRNLTIPHLRRALELKANLPPETINQLAIRLAIDILELPQNTASTPDLSPALAKNIDTYIAQLEARHGPLDARAALGYEALTFSRLGSTEFERSLYACTLLVETSKPAIEFSRLLTRCAQVELSRFEYDNVRRFASLARELALRGGPHYAYERVLGGLLEAELPDHVAGPDRRALLDSTRELATKALSPTHEIWERIEDLHSKSRPSGELARRAPLPGNPRLKPPQILKQTPPEYTKQARAEKYEGVTSIAILVTPDGSGTVINTFRALPYMLSPNVAKAVKEWKFEPWRKDGKPVAGVFLLELEVRPHKPVLP